MKWSRYNIKVSLDENKFLLYNLLYRNLLLIECNKLPENIHLLQEKTFHLLKERFFIVNEDFNEIEAASRLYRLWNNREDVLSLTLIPSMGCNFDCSYCYERERKGIMRRDVIERIKSLIEKRAAKLSLLNLSFFGGEPLCASEIVFEMLNFCNVLKNNYPQMRSYYELTTNGYLLDIETSKMLGLFGINMIQVTLDGPDEYHNSKRKTISGKPTFNRILTNVNNFLEQCKKSFLLLRSNYDEENLEYLIELLDKIPEEFRNRVQVYCRKIWGCGKIDITQKMEREVLDEFYSYAIEHGYRIDFGSFLERYNYCYADQSTYFLVQTDGRLYKCTALESFDEKDSVGNIFCESYKNWGDVPLELDKSCIECKYLPICWGGCRKLRVLAKRSNKKLSDIISCKQVVADIDNRIKWFALQKIRDIKLGNTQLVSIY